MNNPLVSILSPCYNVEQFLPKYFETVLGQTYTNLQVVLIDDGSKDNTWQVLQEYAAKDSRIEVCHQDNMGVAATRNSLLDKVKGDYILFIDSDDWIELNMVEFLLSMLFENDADVVVCEKVINENLCDEGYSADEIWDQGTLIVEFLKHIKIDGSLTNKLIKKSCTNVEKIDIRCSYGEDAVFFWHIIQNVSRIIVTSKKLYHYRIHNASISHQQWTPTAKGSCSLIWKTIVDETEILWPQYANLAKARFAIEDMWGLVFASLSKYPYDKHIKERQLNIRKNLNIVRKSRMVSLNKIVTAYALAYCYPLGRLLKYIIKK